MALSTSSSPRAIPGEIGFLAIYNPSLGTTDESLHDQILYYSDWQARKRSRSRRKREGSPPELSQSEQNERLRQIGLAQGMVEFAKTFSEGKPVDTIETEKSRIILHQIESGWWLVASVNLTRLTTSKSVASTLDKGSEADTSNIEYSSRELKPAALLLQDLLRAHSIFLLHHASSMSALFVRTKRMKFVNLLGRYWDAFLTSWNVMAHGNPLVNMYGGIKLADSGELGIGVGEEERGSGERAVLEGFVGRIEGLVDLVVSKFDKSPVEDKLGVEDDGSGRTQSQVLPRDPWLGTGAEAQSEDGAIFLGVGALSRKSLRDIAYWVEDLYSWGSNAYGVMENPTSIRNSRQTRRVSPSSKIQDTSLIGSNTDPKVDSSLAQPTLDGRSHTISGSGPDKTRDSASTIQKQHPSGKQAEESATKRTPRTQAALPSENVGSTSSKLGAAQSHSRQANQSATDHTMKSQGAAKFASYLKFGYGTHWTLTGPSQTPSQELEAEQVIPQQIPPSIMGASQGKLPKPPIPFKRNDSLRPIDDSMGHFLIGLLGDLSNPPKPADTDSGSPDREEISESSRTLLRTVTVELERAGDVREEVDISIDFSTREERGQRFTNNAGSERTGTSSASYEGQDRNKTKKLRVVVYVNRPFIFTFLFELRTEALFLDGFYKSLHQQLEAIKRPLLLSTKTRLSRPDIINTTTEDGKTPLYDLIWDPKLLTITSTIPNIPDNAQTSNPVGGQIAWSRSEAINTHMQLLSVFLATRMNSSEIEWTCKTSKGWWLVWTRIPDMEFLSTASNDASSRTVMSRKNDSFDTGISGSSSPYQKPSATGSTVDASLTSGPAHPFLEAEVYTKPEPKSKEIFLMRRASDHTSSVTSRFTGRDASNQGGWGANPTRLAQGIGVDTKRYIEGLLNMRQ